MTRHTWWRSSWDLILVLALFVLVCWRSNYLTWQVWVFALLAANANEFHKWSHRTRRENGRVISWLQDLRILQTPRHHACHHTDPKHSHFCTVTNVLNPVLDALRLWDYLEWLLEKSFNLKRRPDTSVRGMGPGPDWLVAYRQCPARDSQ
jgi:ubiquitin-conjugating enzyme E2 variant